MKYVRLLLIKTTDSVLVVIIKQEMLLMLCPFFALNIIALYQFLLSKSALNFIFEVININTLDKF